MLLEIFLGLQAALFIILISFRWHPKKQLKLWSNGLIIAALIYIGFAVFQGAWPSLTQEIIGAIGYTIIAILGYRYSPYFLALGWALHVLWDLLLHNPSDIAPHWYPGVCLGFDLAIAIFVIHLIFNRKNDLNEKASSAGS